MVRYLAIILIITTVILIYSLYKNYLCSKENYSDEIIDDMNNIYSNLTLDNEKLKEYAKEISENYSTTSNRKCRRFILKNLDKSYKKIIKNYTNIGNLNENGVLNVPAGEWLLDNVYLIEKEYKDIKRNMPSSYYMKLPVIDKGNMKCFPRIYKIALEIISKTDGKINGDIIIDFITSYQKNSILSSGEIWALPIMLRIALIQKISLISDEIIYIQNERKKGEELADHVIDYNDRQKLDKVIEELKEKSIDFTPYFTEKFVNIIKDNGVNNIELYDLINENLQRQETYLENIINFGHRKQSKQQMIIGNCITAMRTIEAIDWRNVFERTSIVEKILLKDPSGIYGKMDFPSKDNYRHTIEKMSKKIKLPETYIAQKAIECAENIKESEDQYKSHVGFYIVKEEGRNKLEEKINYRKKIKDKFKIFLSKHKVSHYISFLSLGTIIFDLLVLFSIYYTETNFNIYSVIFQFLILLIPCSEIIFSIVNWTLNNLMEPDYIPKLEFKNGIPEESSTVVVIPTLINNKKRVNELMDEMEVYYLANKEKNIYFALLSDFKDSNKKENKEDKGIIDEALKKVKLLNDKYSKEGENIFFFFSRYRKFNKKENLWMGWERKRGKLVEFNKMIRGDKNTSYDVFSSDISPLKKVKYVITLDADTKLPRDSAKKLIGAMEHILNRPVIDKKNKRVVFGYGLMQPRISVSIESANKTTFSSIFSGEVGIDMYTTAISDTYQDLFNEGIYTGKGIYNLDVFNYMLSDEIPEDTVLSHDLLEGSYVRAGLVTDIELIDGYPAYYISNAKRIHRWVRGDWQLLPWIKSKSINRLSKWKIIDNLRRSLLSVSIVFLIILSLIFPFGTETMITIGFISVVAPILFNVSDTVVSPIVGLSLSGKIDGIKRICSQFFLIFTFIPHKAYLMVDAIIRTLYRISISKKNLLQWQTAEDAERLSGKNLKNYISNMWIASFLSIVIGYFAYIKSLSIFLFVIPTCIIWFFSPYIAYFVSKDKKKKIRLNEEDEFLLRNLSLRTWTYFKDYVCENTNWLSPDNYQEEPYKGIAYRTSPTNIGMGITSNIAAYDLGFIGTTECLQRIKNTLDNMDKLDKYKGHFYNWYNIKTMKPLNPRYISAVDSGNLVGYLWVTSKAIEGFLNKPLIREEQVKGLDSLVHLANDELKDNEDEEDFYNKEIFLLQNLKLNIVSWSNILNKINTRSKELINLNINKKELYWNLKLQKAVDSLLIELENIFPWKNQEYNDNNLLKTLDKDVIKGYTEGSIKDLKESLVKSKKYLQDDKENENNFIDAIEIAITNIENLKNNIYDLINRLNTLSDETDFSILYDKERNLFSIGYNFDCGKLEKCYYDLLASEARQASFVAIAKGDIPKDNWVTLGRSLSKMARHKGLASWSGTMFEYFMPLLIMKNYPNTLLDQTYKAVIEAQKNYGETRNIPWGISESAYYSFDPDLNYQYRAFGVPGIGIKRGLEKDLVVSPYSTVLALQGNLKDSIENIKRLTSLNAIGRHGFYESIDYTKDRLSKDKEKLIVKSFMVHHQGMSLMALDNVINNNIFQNRFHSIPEVKATELLLQEKVSKRVVFERKKNKYNQNIENKEINIYSRVYNTHKSNIPRVNMLSNGNYSSIISNKGSGYSKAGDISIYRWREDVTLDSSGMFFYIKNINSNEFWSATYEPCKNEGEEHKIIFFPDKAEFSRKDGNIMTKTEIIVSQEEDAEIRNISITNTGNHSRIIEVTSYLESTLANFNADLVHPAFSNLFMKTECLNDPFCIAANRRRRSKKDKSLWLIQTVAVNGEKIGDFEYETSRINFIGRGRNLASPRALDSDFTLKGTIGAVLDPIISIRVRIKIPKGETCNVAYTTAVSNSKDRIINIAKKYRDINNVVRAFDLAWTQSKLQMKYLDIKSSQANIYQYLASNILFINDNLKHREKYIKNIKGSQKDLWAYGISGDNPIMLITINSEKNIDSIRRILTMYKYWQIKGLQVDTVIVNTKESSYITPVENSILDLVNSLGLTEKRNKPGGIFVYSTSTMDEKDFKLLKGISRIYIDCEKGELIKQIDVCNELKDDNSNLLVKKDMNFKIKPYSFEIPKLKYFNNIGGFDVENSEYTMVLKDYNNTPLPWINVISNKNFGFHISESGSSYSWYKNSRENKITNWSNDPIIDGESEEIYIRDNETSEAFSISPKPIRDKGEYIISHGFGYSKFKHYAKGIIGEMTTYCPREDTCKISIIKLTNNTNVQRKLSIMYYAEMVLGVSKQLTSQYISTYYDKEDKFIYSNNAYSSDFKDSLAYLKIIGGNNSSFTGDRTEFIGAEGSIEKPKALGKINLNNKVGAGVDPCLAESVEISIKPSEEKYIIAILGAEDSKDKIKDTIIKYKDIDNCFNELEKVKVFWKDLLGNIQVKTPDESMNIMLNGWLLYQVITCRLWSRTAFYQSGGAYGFRDQLQDVMSVSYVKPEMTRKQIIYSASRQFKEGDVQHWWHPIVDSGIRTRFSDDLLWLPYVTIDYIKNTGDYSILDEEVNYLEDSPLREGEDERYTISSISSYKDRIYDHCIKAIDKALKFGDHNIPLMGSGDWNDGMSTIGNGGKGESVWLGWFLYSILTSFVKLCKYKNDDELVSKYDKYIKFIKENQENNAWDGSWYRRAYFDDGTPLGSIQNEECKIDSLSQSWSVLSGAGKKKRVEEAMEAVEKNLVRKEKGMIALLTPPFDKSKLEPGYIKGYLPGVRENGGQYTHAAIWTVLAFAKLKREDKAWKLFNMINPINHSKSYLNCSIYKVEPYVMTADIYDREPHIGRGGWSWYTGAASWMYRTGIEGILGLKFKENKGFYIDPCVPKEWESYEIDYNRGESSYHINVVREEEKGVWVNNKLMEDGLVPFYDKGKYKVKVSI